MKSLLVYKFTYASCSSNFIGETCRHFKTRIEEHIKKDHKFPYFKHLHFATTCFDSYNSLCFKIIGKANYKFDLKIKEALHINWRKLKCTTKSFSSLPFAIACVPLLQSVFVCFSLVVFLHFSLICCFHYLYANYWHLWLS